MAEDFDAREILSQFNDIFSEFLGGPPTGAQRDVALPVAVTAVEAADGVEKEVRVTRFIACSDCGGVGAPEGSATERCEACEGAGGTRDDRGKVLRWCERCHGRGHTFVRTCHTCLGEGGDRRTKPVRVSVPAGAQDGQQLRLRGMGGELADGQGPGDLYLTVSVLPDLQITREGDDLHAIVDVSEEVADRGGVVTLSKFDPPLELELPPGAVQGHEVRLRGCGAQKIGAPATPRPTGKESPYRDAKELEHRGDLVVRVHIPSRANAAEIRVRHLRTLGLDAEASETDIKRAYRAAAVRMHPDVAPPDSNGDDFEELARAYEAIMSSPAPRLDDPRLRMGRTSLGQDAPPKMTSPGHMPPGVLYALIALASAFFAYLLLR